MSEPHTTTRRSHLQIVWLGDGSRPEFAPTYEMLCRRANVVAYRGWADADLPADDLAPALVVVAQGFAGAFDAIDAVRLRRRYPTAALVRIVASWCEGELRSAPPLVGVKRYVAHQAFSLLAADLTRLECGMRPDWGLPATATEEESLSAANTVAGEHRNAPLQVGIAARDPFVERWLFALCERHSGLKPTLVDCRATAGVGADGTVPVVVWDVPSGSEAAEAELGALASTGARVIALASFPRREQVAEWRASGVVDVIGKPVSDAALLACLGSVAP